MSQGHKNRKKMKALKIILAAAVCLIPAALGAQASKVETGEFKLAAGERGEFPTNFIRVQTRLTAEVSFTKFQPVGIGRGSDKTYRSGWVEVTDNEVVIYDVVLKNKTLEEDAAVSGDSKKVKTIRARVPEEVGRYAHGLNFRKVKALEVSIDVGDAGAELKITTKKGEFVQSLPKWWAGGAPFVQNLGTEPVNAMLAFERKKADAPIWFIADSYFNSTSRARWPYYMVKDGYTDWMADHLPGGSAPGLLPCFKHDLEFGTPKIVVWELQGNIGPDEGLEPSPKWLKAVEEFLSICKEKGITPVFTTAPSVRQNVAGRNKWIKDHGYRVLDFREALVNEDGTDWKDPSWRSKDGVHPSPSGAVVLWETVKKGLPELR